MTAAAIARRAGPPVAGVALLLAVWEVGVRLFDVPTYTLPPPTDVAGAFGEVKGVLPGHLAATTQIAGSGLAIGVGTGVLVAATLSAVPWLRRSMQPLLVASQSVPSVVLAPILVSFLGFGTLPRLIVVALVVFFPVAVAAIDGLASADDDLVGLVATMGASRWHTLWWIRIPHAAGPFFSGVRIAAAYAMFGAIVAEWMGAERGLGVYFNRVRASYRMDRVLVAIVVIAVTSIVLYSTVSTIGRLATPWLRAADRPTTTTTTTTTQTPDKDHR
ncbi:ABC transporter permease [Desertimonas flava]|uniref:ABC transporter permease n=1 Tax=Desertimonas flava TaxID=2064846 RepID=UPI0013C4E2FF|nr:ABC transporter permease [Desertimonas flava]